MAGSPISVVVRDADVLSLTAILNRCQSLLIGRRQPDEIVLGLRHEPISRPPSNLGRLIVRTVVHSRIAERQGLEWLLANAKWPVAIFVGSDADLPQTSVTNMLATLDRVDVAIGRRRNAPGRRSRPQWWPKWPAYYALGAWNAVALLRYPVSFFLRRLFAVAAADPLTPYFAVRREAVAGITLQMNSLLASFELYAKLTFAFVVLDDEVDVELPGGHEALLNRLLWVERRQIAELFRKPSFWSLSKNRESFRIIPQVTRAPRYSVVMLSRSKTKRLHPLRAQPHLDYSRPFELSRIR